VSSPHPKIFLSSTYVDLRNVRAKVIRWLADVFDAPLIIMETAGSDAAPPNITSVRRVRQCEIFIGIYGHRYGTIDPATGESITELELDEARSAQSAGVVNNLLLYLIDPTSTWLSEFVDMTCEADTGRQRLRDKLHQHTYTVCRNEKEILRFMIRDVYRAIIQQYISYRRTLREFNPPTPMPMRRPVGMEFLTSRDSDCLIGRESEINDTISQLTNEPIVLLLGESGVGKTSLIHAGIIPKAQPFTFPRASLE